MFFNNISVIFQQKEGESLTYDTLEDCANYGKITSTGWNTGGIAGQMSVNGSIQNVFFEDGKVEADVVKAFTKQQIKSGEVADFKYIRTFDAYKWQPLYVPFRMSLEQLTANGLSVATPVDIEVVEETITRLNVNKLSQEPESGIYIKDGKKYVK